MRLVIFTLFLCSFIYSCSKEKIKQTIWEEGVYIWDYSYYNGTVNTPDSTKSNFAIKILKKGKVEFYKDQEMIDFGKFSSFKSIKTQSKNIELLLDYDGVYQCNSFPFTNFNNYFKKIK